MTAFLQVLRIREQQNCSRRLPAVFLAGLLVAVPACSDSSDPTEPGGSQNPAPEAGALMAVSPVHVEAQVASEVEVVVRVTTVGGDPVPGQSVAFSVLTGGGSAAGTATTDAAGAARVDWTLGTVVGENELRASVTGLDPITFRAASHAGPAAVIQPVFGHDQSVPAGAMLPYSVIARVTDAWDNPVGGVDVNFEVVQGGGRVFPFVTRTSEATGWVLALWRTGPNTGANRLRLSSSAVPEPLEVDATGRSVQTNFDLELDLEDPGALTTGQLEALESARRRVRALVTAAPPQIPVEFDEFNCHGVQVPAMNRQVGNPVIRVVVRDFATDPDLGHWEGFAAFGTVCAFRHSSGHNNFRVTVLGLVALDQSAIGGAEATGMLDAFLTHELMHALGFGTLWHPVPQLGWSDLVQGRGGANPRFLGANATAAYGALPGNQEGAVPVPLEDTDPGRDAHWRPASFGFSELMFSQAQLGWTPLSRPTAASLADLGYPVALAQADPFVIGANPADLLPRLAGPAVAGLGVDPEALRAAMDELGRTVLPYPCADGHAAHHGAFAIDVASGHARWLEPH